MPENLAYALVQIAHNFGAAAVVGGTVFWLWPQPQTDHARLFAWLILAGWSIQIASGILFGVTSLHYYGETPDLSATAMTALITKIGSAATGLLLDAWYLARGRNWGAQRTRGLFHAQAGLAMLALTAAAVLRWFS